MYITNLGSSEGSFRLVFYRCANEFETIDLRRESLDQDRSLNDDETKTGRKLIAWVRMDVCIEWFIDL